MGAALIAGGLLVVFGAPAVRPAWGFGLLVLPAAVGAATGRRSGRPRLALVALWAVAAAVALALTGGLSGPMIAVALAPVLAEAMLGGGSIAGWIASLAALLAGHWAARVVDWPWTGVGSGDARVDAWTAALALAGAGLAAASVLRPRRSTLVAAEVETPAATPVEDAVQALRADRLERERDEAQAAQWLAESALHQAEEGRRAARAVLQVTVEGRETAEARVREAEQARDAAEARKAEAEAARVRAEEVAEARIRFLANMSHELRTPLNAIMGFSDIMRQRLFGPLSDRYAEYADLIHDSGRHLLDLINDVLDMAKVEARRFELNPERFDGREPVQAALRLLRRQAEESGVALRAVLPNAEVEVDADRRAIKQIVLNLVSNALKFTPGGGEVTVIAGPRDHAFEIAVSDTGIGIAEDDLERLGRPFEQVGNGDAKLQGSGLGLSLVKAMAGLHGGTMLMESRLGEGTAVTVTLPVLAVAPPVEAMEEGEASAAEVIPLAR